MSDRHFLDYWEVSWAFISSHDRNQSYWPNHVVTPMRAFTNDKIDNTIFDSFIHKCIFYWICSKHKVTESVRKLPHRAELPGSTLLYLNRLCEMNWTVADVTAAEAEGKRDSIIGEHVYFSEESGLKSTLKIIYKTFTPFMNLFYLYDTPLKLLHTCIYILSNKFQIVGLLVAHWMHCKIWSTWKGYSTVIKVAFLINIYRMHELAYMVIF